VSAPTLAALEVEGRRRRDVGVAASARTCNHLWEKKIQQRGFCEGRKKNVLNKEIFFLHNVAFNSWKKNAQGAQTRAQVEKKGLAAV